MLIQQADPAFRPVTLVFETQDELDKLLAVLETVAQNKVCHIPQVVTAAKEMRATIVHGVDEL